jgi:hypothetical protein
MSPDDEAVPGDRTSEDRLSELIADTGLGLFPHETQERVEQILATGQGLEPPVRARFVDAARRGTRSIAVTHEPLEVVLFHSRRSQHQALDDLSSATGIGEGDMRAIERGERSINSVGASAVALWAVALDLRAEIVGAALIKSLGKPVTTSSYGERRDVRLTDDERTFIDTVVQLVQERNQPPQDNPAGGAGGPTAG